MRENLFRRLLTRGGGVVPCTCVLCRVRTEIRERGGGEVKRVAVLSGGHFVVALEGRVRLLSYQSGPKCYERFGVDIYAQTVHIFPFREWHHVSNDGIGTQERGSPLLVIVWSIYLWSAVGVCVWTSDGYRFRIEFDTIDRKSDIYFDISETFDTTSNTSDRSALRRTAALFILILFTNFVFCERFCVCVCVLRAVRVVSFSFLV